MNIKKLENIKVFADTHSIKKGEPGIHHSYIASLATALNYINGELNPAWLMGSSAFAFRIFVNETLCPSAMSMFSFKEVLPAAVEQAGYNCIYSQRMWNETDKEEEKRRNSHKAVIEGLDRAVPSIVWDLFDAEWGLIIGYDNEKELYYILSHEGKESVLPFNKLGRNGIDILSVATPGDPNLRKQDEIIIESLKVAVAHAEGKEWIDDRPKYQNGILAFDLWASIFEKWAWIEGAGKSDKIGLDIQYFARYYAGHYYSARCYARDYLGHIAEGNKHLQNASLAYGLVADFLKPLWEYFSEKKKPESKLLKSFAQNIKDAKNSEEEGIGLIKIYLN
jgi:hypothetical protein